MISANIPLVILPDYARTAMKEFGCFSLRHFSPAIVVKALKEVQASEIEEIVYDRSKTLFHQPIKEVHINER